jgi:hypothetical protein
MWYFWIDRCEVETNKIYWPKIWPICFDPSSHWNFIFKNVPENIEYSKTVLGVVTDRWFILSQKPGFCGIHVQQLSIAPVSMPVTAQTSLHGFGFRWRRGVDSSFSWQSVYNTSICYGTGTSNSLAFVVLVINTELLYSTLPSYFLSSI